MNYIGRGNIIPSSWTIVDVLGVVVCSSVLILALFYLGTFIDSDKNAFTLFRYAGSLVMLSLPIAWLRSRYRIKVDALGLRKGNYSVLTLVLIGILAAVALGLVFRVSQSQQTNMGQHSISFLQILLYPISIGGSATVVLTPLAEEIMDRGFLYGYLRMKMNIALALLFQAGLFSVGHIIYIYEDPFQLILFFLAGGMFGIIYEFSGSLYPSIICHGTLNYLLAVISVVN